ncbi:unnamed protein product [Leptosia nina]|uniref:Polypeptide N-acetylgalactosaminyltransferase n=1 Tax=Leptosia nina TaxID=320188 RepID=A0AAV1K6T4_9NEOP
MQRREISAVDNLRLYEQALRKFRSVYEKRNNFTDSLASWNLVGPASLKLSMKDKLSAVKNTEFPVGMNGIPVDIEDDVNGFFKSLIRRGWKDHCFNQFVSDLIPINRTLPDYRDEWCKQRNYSNNLPEASIVICFHNEAWSTLLRTVDSVIKRSPSHLVKEIILFDDFSTMDHLKEDLENHVRTLPKVTLIRANRRKGLIRARILGAKYATAPVVLFLDSHCECTIGWLEPLLDRIKRSSATVVSPVVDHIDVTTFEFIPQTSEHLQLGGFEWDLKFMWRPIPKYISRKRKYPSAPIKTPTISGGLFAINKSFFKKLGFYDEGYRIWGAENLEISFKTWMCGGVLEIIPCSHVGHVFRKTFPYKSPKRWHRINSMRLAEVWLDDYAKYYYQRIGGIKDNFGDVTKRRELREKLKCKSFEWYMQNIYPEMKLPDMNVAYGQIYNMGEFAACLDASSTFVNVQSAVSVKACHLQGGNQTKAIQHEVTKKCLSVKINFGGSRLELDLYECANLTTQEWVMENFDGSRLLPHLRLN